MSNVRATAQGQGFILNRQRLSSRAYTGAAATAAGSRSQSQQHPSQPPPAQQQQQPPASPFNSLDRRPDLGGLFVPLQPDHYPTYTRNSVAGGQSTCSKSTSIEKKSTYAAESSPPPSSVVNFSVGNTLTSSSSNSIITPHNADNYMRAMPPVLSSPARDITLPDAAHHLRTILLHAPTSPPPEALASLYGRDRNPWAFSKFATFVTSFLYLNAFSRDGLYLFPEPVGHIVEHVKIRSGISLSSA
ncbi:hypothetical protein DFH94DRAFT_678208 [Russula ochroleuca]|uniref:Uncharacterized protein n=1 Tax=Russula ochroleuca TaxID=152965 RepID=A0A9P5N5N5_9AGAM|nr:hypothetical protein DFH94DRAFT_678208 [Russula ochroleuca]